MSFKESVVHVYTKPRKGVPSNHCLVTKGVHSFYSGHFYLKTLLVGVLLVENCFKISWLQCSFFSTVNWSTLLVRVGARHSLQLISGDARLWMFSSLALIFKRYYTKFLLHFPSCLMPMNLKRLLTALQNLRSDKTCPNAEFMEYMTKRRIKLSSWSWAGSAMNRTTSIRRYWDIRMNNELSLHGPRFESEVKLNLFLLTCHAGSKWTVGACQSCCPGCSWGDGCRLRDTMICPNLVFSVVLISLIPLGGTH